MNAIDKLIAEYERLYSGVKTEDAQNKLRIILDDLRALKEKGIEVSATTHRGKAGEWDIQAQSPGNAVLFIDE